MQTQVNIAVLLDAVLPGLSRRRKAPSWPPDAFLVAALLLTRSGAYTSASTAWPPTKSAKEYRKLIYQVGSMWRGLALSDKVPPRISKWWNVVISSKKTRIAEIHLNRPLCNALIQMLAAADEACAGVGIPHEPEAQFDPFKFEADRQLLPNEQRSTLCKEISYDAGVVLPKMHTPQTGFTLRSFSMHLAYVEPGEMRPVWHQPPVQQPKGNYNVLVFPWPTRVRANSFGKVSQKDALMQNLPNSFGFFRYIAPVNKEDVAARVLSDFRKIAGRPGAPTIHAVILPELALSEDEYQKVSSELFNSSVLVISGVHGPGTNCLRFNIPSVTNSPIQLRQTKHHRWRINKSQIRTYGLELSQRKHWWEHIPITDRALNFVALTPTLAISSLICEDLARPDPVGNVIRAVGPNLVIALLMDGPQLESRWPGRYVAALAEDPGCSVLSLTCLGMARLSIVKDEKKGIKKKKKKPSNTNRIVGLWKDPINGTANIQMNKGADSALLTLKVSEEMEWTADGRDDGRVTGYPILKKIVYFKKGNQVDTKVI
jgi:hypothetical protein